MLLTKQVEVKITKSNIEYFSKKGFVCKLKDKIKINPYVLQKKSEKEIEYQCDNCGEIIKLHWCDYLKKKEKEYSEDGDFCTKCVKAKRAEWYKKNKKEEYQESYQKARDKAKQTCLEKYGCENVMQNSKIKKKLEDTIYKKYGVNNVMQLPEIREKLAKTLGNNQELEIFTSENGKEYYRYKGIPCSNNQLHLNQILGGELNGYISYYPVDLLFEEDKIYVEYNGTGHNLSVKMKKITKEEQTQKEIKRYYFLKDKGYKQILFTSLTKRKLPSDEIIESLFVQAQEYLKQGHNWIEFNLDQNYIKWKEGKIDYNFDTLVKINF